MIKRIAAVSLAVIMTAGGYAPACVGAVSASADSIGSFIYMGTYGDFTYVVEDGVLSITEYSGSDEDVVIPAEINDIKVTAVDYGVFTFKKSMKTLTIPDGVTNLGMGFQEAANLEAFIVDEDNTVYSSFDGVLYSKDQSELICCPRGKTSIIFPDGVRTINDQAFQKCTKLKGMKIPNIITSIGNEAFFNCTGFTEISIPDSVTSIGKYAFDDCTGVESITVGENNTAYTSVDGVLYNKDKTELICCPCKKTSVTIPDGVTVISDFAFDSCEDLTEITIPASVTRIGGWAFENTTKLKTINYLGTKEQWDAIEIGGDNEYLSADGINYTGSTSAETHSYPKASSIEYDGKYHRFRLSWTPVPDAERYGIAVYVAGKWKIQTQNIPASVTSYTSPKLKAGQTYKILVAAKVNGKWDLTSSASRAVNVTVR